MIAWMLYLTLVGVLVTLAARSAESIGRALGYPVRWVWAGALVALAIFAAVAPLRNDVYAPLPFKIRATEVTASAPPPVPTFGERVSARLGSLGSTMNAAVRQGVQRIDRALPKNAATWLLALSVGAWGSWFSSSPQSSSASVARGDVGRLLMFRACACVCRRMSAPS